MLRGVVVGRKNHYGSRSPRGTEFAAIFYSLIETAKLAGVGPNTYLRAATMAVLRGEPMLLSHQLGLARARVVCPPAGANTGKGEVAALIDWASLELCPGNFIDPQLTERQTDLLFTVRCAGHDAGIYILFEHQSTSDRFMAFRLHRYVVRTWEAFLRDNPTAKRLPDLLAERVLTATTVEDVLR